MKTTKTMLALAIFAISSLVSNQALAQRPGAEEIKARRAEMIERQAERLAKELELKGDAKSQFIASYKTYQEELQGTQDDRRNLQRPGADNEKKKLTDEEAQKQVDQYFARQEAQIAQQQKRLEVDRKYYEEFKKTLTPQQLAKVFRQRQNGRQGGQGGQRPGGQGGFGGQRQGGFGDPQGGMDWN